MSGGDERLEPNTVADTDDGHCLHSMAISAKRQADAAERIAEALATMAGEMAHPEWGVAPAIREAARNGWRS